MTDMESNERTALLPSGLRIGRPQSIDTLASNLTELPQYSPVVQDDQERATFAGLTSPSYTTLVPSDHRSAGLDSNLSLATLVQPSGRQPPRYSTAIRASGEAALTNDGLYPHCFPLTSGSNPRAKPWAAVYLRDAEARSREPRGRSSKRPVKVSGGEPVTGVLELDLAHGMSITTIKFILKGRVVAGYLADNTYNILEHTIVLWNKSYGDPKHPQPGKEFDGKFSPGQYRFPFSFPFPTHVNTRTLGPPDAPLVSPPSPDVVTPFPYIASVASGSSSASIRKGRSGSILNPANWRSSRLVSPPASSSRFPNQDESFPTSPNGNSAYRIRANEAPFYGHPDIHPLPPSFLEVGVDANTTYEVTLVISHGMLRGDDRIKIPLTYTPVVSPPPSSLGRRMAYELGSTLPGPLSDREGWSTLSTVLMTGKLEIEGQNPRNVELQCSLSLAEPLSYARGTVVPCYMTMTSQSVVALDALAKPAALNVRLSRSVAWSKSLGEAKARIAGGHGASKESPVNAPFLAFEQSAPFGSVHAPNIQITSPPGPEAKSVATASWRPCHHASNSRTFEGEILLAEDLHPSSMFPVFTIQYYVELLSFRSAAFTPYAPARQAPAQPQLEGPNRRHRVYLSQPVVITTALRRDEAPPRTFSSRLQAEHLQAPEESSTESGSLWIANTLLIPMAGDVHIG